MGKLRCLCGNVISDVLSPSANNGWLISQIDHENIDEKNGEDVLDFARDVWECHECGRIGIGTKPDGDGLIKWYAPEDGKTGNLFKD